jgi:hypothetical protein
MKTVPMTVLETPFFIKKSKALLTEAEREDLITMVGLTREAGDVIPETGGVRKIRWRIQGKGKSGGVRVIYYFHNEAFPIFLLTVYAKNQKANLTPAERNELRQLVPLPVKTYSKRRQP